MEAVATERAPEPRPPWRGLAAGLAMVLCVAFWLQDPAGTIRGEAVAGLARGGLPALLWLGAALGAGGAILTAAAPELLAGAGGWVPALIVGTAVQSAGMGVFAALGAIGPLAGATVLLASAAGWAARPAIRLPRVPAVVVGIGALLLLPGLVESLAPPTDTDELSYQLALPRVMAETGRMVGGFLHPEGSRPMPIHLLFAGLYAIGGEAAPRLWHLGITAALALAVRALAEERYGAGRGDLPALALLGSWSVLREAGLASNNLPVALCLLVAADAMLERRWRWMGWCCGFALAAKYTAAPVVAGMALVAAWDGLRKAPGRVVTGGLFVLAPLVPWWLRNVADGLHPLFPFAGWPDAADFVFMYPEKYGAGRDLAAWLALPWNVLFRAETDSFVFYGRLSLLWAGIVATALAFARRDGATRRLLFVSALGFAGWAAGVQIFRYLLPMLGVMALGGGTLPRRWPAWLLLLASLPANLAPALERAADRVAVATGNEPREAFLQRVMPAWGAVSFLRDHVPSDAPVALLFAWQGYWVEQPWVLGSVEDHVPTRYWIYENGDASLTTLRDAGVRYLLVGDVHFLKKSYGFLSPDVLDAQFKAPEEKLRELLLRDATRLYAADKWEIWRLDEPRATAP